MTLINAGAIQQTQRTFARASGQLDLLVRIGYSLRSTELADLIQTCYGKATGKLM